MCIDTYTNFHFTERWGHHPEATRFVAPELLAALNEMHAARREGRELSDERKRRVFESHFFDEQQHVVGPRINDALSALEWPLVKAAALKPLIRFAYFPARTYFWFQHFDRREERITRGLQAFDIAASVGWDQVEATLRNYAVLPTAFFDSSTTHFVQLREAVLSAT